MFTVCGLCHGRIHSIPRPLNLRKLNKLGREKAKNNLHYHIRLRNKTIGKRIRVLVTIAENLGQGDIVRQALDQLDQSKNKATTVNREKILIDIQRVFNKLGRIISSSKMLNELQILENPEYNWLKFDEKPLTITALSRFFNELFQVNTKLDRIKGKVCRVYLQKDFRSAWEHHDMDVYDWA
jgi:hypothetical protein